MTTITEDYVSFETAKLLKEKGFNGVCNAYYDCFTTDNFHSGCEPTDFNSIDTKIRDIVSAPTLQMAMKWLREVHNLYIQPEITPWPQKGYFVKIYLYNNRYNNFEEVLFVEHKESYEQVVEAAIKYCLEHLI